VTIDEEFQKLIPPLTDDEYRQLEENCIKEGIREAILVWDRGDDLVIVDGHNRYKIAREHNLKWNHKVMNFESREDAKIWIVKNQLGRRNLLPQVRALLALKVEPLIAEKAKERQKGGQGGVLLSQKSDEAKEISTKKELAKIAGVSHDTIHKIKKIEAEATPHIKELLYSGTITTNQAYNTTFPKTLNPVKEATKEHEEYQEKLKSGVVDINEAKKDKTNQDILYNGFMVELYKVLRTVTGFGMMYTYKDIDKHTKKIPQQESEDLILKLDAVIGVLDYVRTEIERSNNERN
jgi:hypothetical protein